MATYSTAFLLIIAGIYCVQAQGDISFDDFKQAVNDCAQQYSIDQQTIQNVVSYVALPGDDDDNFKDFTACWMDKCGFITDGQIDLDGIQQGMSVLYPDNTDQAYQLNVQCASQDTGTTESDIAYQLLSCFVDGASAAGLPPLDLDTDSS